MKNFQVAPGSKVRLSHFDPGFIGKHTPESASLATDKNKQRLKDLQELLYAEHKHSLLVCLQAIDAGGKDGTIRHVFGAMNPQGCKVATFRPPCDHERNHDFLWRAHRDAPACGDVTIFNRSHYEDVLIERVRGLVPKSVWSKRYAQINDMERILSENGTHILKFFLHISKDEQLKRFQERLADPTKHWKISEADYTERARWDEYMDAFDAMLSKCSTDHAPWHIIPADNKWFRDLAVSQITADTMESLDMQYPPPQADLKKIKKLAAGA